ncbi:HAMP domain-containing protein [Nostoc sp.]|uniref:HAMP domain-containing protein n=1 Tax=Nostoc sp. TaxID=1180 RepID=UPI002FFC4CAD
MQKVHIQNKSVEQLLVEIEGLKQKLLVRENEKSDLEILLETTTEHSTNIEAELHNTNEQMSRYLQQVYSITNAAAAVEAGTFQSHTLDEVANRSDELGQLARVFQRMTEQIKTREEKLKQQVEQLRIEIDQFKRMQQVSEITKTDSFQQLKQKVKQLRK